MFLVSKLSVGGISTAIVYLVIFAAPPATIMARITYYIIVLEMILKCVRL